jgi:hypothetical protein
MLLIVDSDAEVMALVTRVTEARVEERNRSAPEVAPRIEPSLIAFWNARIQRPDADELALVDVPSGPLG